MLAEIGAGLSALMSSEFGGAIMSGLTSIAGSAITSGINSLMQNGSSSSATSQQSQQYSNMAETSAAETATTQQGNTSALGNLISSALTTPTANSSQQAAQFGAQSAQTANNLQNNQWNNANMFNGLSQVISTLMNAASQTSAKNYNEKQQQIARDYNAAQSKLTRDWQEKMRGTAHQDTIKDLKAAGLNPILSATQGANGNYTGAEASGGAASIGAQGYNGTSAAGIPTAHTASMQAMYDYGNNTSQFLNNMMATINSAKQSGYTSTASRLEQAMDAGAISSANQISKYATMANEKSSSSNKYSSEQESKEKQMHGSSKLDTGGQISGKGNLGALLGALGYGGSSIVPY